MMREACRLAWRTIDCGGGTPAQRPVMGLVLYLPTDFVLLRLAGLRDHAVPWRKTAFYWPLLPSWPWTNCRRSMREAYCFRWLVQAADEVGIDIPLYLTIRNEVDSPDALLRARCPITNFSESTSSITAKALPPCARFRRFRYLRTPRWCSTLENITHAIANETTACGG